MAPVGPNDGEMRKSFLHPNPFFFRAGRPWEGSCTPISSLCSTQESPGGIPLLAHSLGFLRGERPVGGSIWHS